MFVYIRMKEAVELFGISRRTIEKKIANGVIDRSHIQYE